IRFKQRPVLVLPQEPGAIDPLPGVGRANPIVDWRRHEPYRLGCFRFFADHQKHLGVTAFLGRTESLDRAECNFIQVELVLDRAQTSGLLTDQLCISVLDDARTVLAWLYGCSDEIFKSLRNSPYAGVPLPGCPEE